MVVDLSMTKRYGKLKIIKEVKLYVLPSGRKHRKVLCKCKCGNRVKVFLHNLKSGHTKSCGCLQREIAIDTKTTHGLSNNLHWGRYWKIIDRCINDKCFAYPKYGGRGIYVCKRWLPRWEGDTRGFKRFIRDMGPTYDKGLSLERLDNNGPYAPWNCKWGTDKEQAQNRRDNIVVFIKGKELCLAEAHRRYGKVSYAATTKRIREGWDPKEAILTPRLK